MGIIDHFFFRILHGEYLLKQKIVVLQTSEWKFKENIARNITFEGRLGQLFAPGQKWQKTDYFQEFHFSLPVLKSQN